MLKISSRDNQRIKNAVKARDSLIKEKIFVEGARLAEEILRSGVKIHEVFFTENFSQTSRGRNFLDSAAIYHPIEVSEKLADSLADTKNSQGIFLVCEKPETDKAQIELSLDRQTEQFPLVILLHKINNPANLGAILRTCEAVGVSGIILTKNSADVFSPKALRGAMGASLRLPIWTNADFYDVINWAKAKNFITICADVNAEKSYLDIDWRIPRLLIFGDEANGLTEEERAAIDESLIVPMENNVESLNLAVSCGVILFESKRRRT